MEVVEAAVEVADLVMGPGAVADRAMALEAAPVMALEEVAMEVAEVVAVEEDQEAAPVLVPDTDPGMVRAQDMDLGEPEEVMGVAEVEAAVAVLGPVRALDPGPGMDPDPDTGMEVDLGNPHYHDITIPPKYMPNFFYLLN